MRTLYANTLDDRHQPDRFLPTGARDLKAICREALASALANFDKWFGTSTRDGIFADFELRGNSERHLWMTSSDASSNRQHQLHQATLARWSVAELDGSFVRFGDLAAEHEAHPTSIRFCRVKRRKQIGRIQ
jgi:hypothetical protein